MKESLLKHSAERLLQISDIISASGESVVGSSESDAISRPINLKHKSNVSINILGIKLFGAFNFEALKDFESFSGIFLSVSYLNFIFIPLCGPILFL